LNDGKSFYWSQKDHKLIYLSGSMELKLCLVIDGKWLKIYFGSDWWGGLGVSKKTIVTVTFNMLLIDGKSFYWSQKEHKLIYLSGSMALKLCLVIDGKWFKIHFGSDWWCGLGVSKKTIVTGIFNMILNDGKSFLEVKKTTNAYTYEV